VADGILPTPRDDGAWTLHCRAPNDRAEIDCVLETAAGDWVGVEAKLGGNEAIDNAVRRLKHVEGSMRRPAKNLVIVTAGGLAEARRGVQIAPLGALGP
jgi:hypothetical protein